MKNSKCCTKCGSTSIVQVKGQVQVHGCGNNIKVGMTMTSAVPVDRFVCLTCGFVEEWITNDEYLEMIRQHYDKGDLKKMYPWNKE